MWNGWHLSNSDKSLEVGKSAMAVSCGCSAWHIVILCHNYTFYSQMYHLNSRQNTPCTDATAFSLDISWHLVEMQLSEVKVHESLSGVTLSQHLFMSVPQHNVIHNKQAKIKKNMKVHLNVTVDGNLVWCVGKFVKVETFCAESFFPSVPNQMDLHQIRNWGICFQT